MEILKSNTFLIILFVISLASLIGVIALIISTKKQSERYKKMLEKLGNGKNIENDIMAYVEKVESVSKQNDEIINYCQNMVVVIQLMYLTAIQIFTNHFKIIKHI